MTIDALLSQAQVFEDGAALLQGALDDLDERHAQAVAQGLARLLAAGLAATHPDMGTLAASLLAGLQAEGASALWTCGADGYPAPEGLTPAEQGLQDALRLSENPELRHLGALVAYHAETSLHDYPREAVLSALIEAAGTGRDPSLDDDLDRIDALRDQVRLLPARRAAAVDTVYEVLPGDTIRDVAFAVLGDHEAWQELVRLYGLVPPYLSEFGASDGVLRPGERLQIPAGVAAASWSGSGLGQTLALRAEDRQRVDLALSEDGDLLLDAGLSGFASDLGLRAMTPQGDLPEEPEYGVPSVAGMPATEAALARALLMPEALYQDDRVGQVTAAYNARSDVPRGVLVEDVVVLPRPELVGM